MRQLPSSPFGALKAPLFYRAAAPTALAAALLHAAVLRAEAPAPAQTPSLSAATAPAQTPVAPVPAPAPTPTPTPAPMPAPPSPSPTAAVPPATQDGAAPARGNGVAAPNAASAPGTGHNKRLKVGADRRSEEQRGNVTVANFAQAKAHLNVLYSERPRTIYTDCTYTAERRIDYDQCRFRPHKTNARAYRIEWEHVVPAEAFGQAFACWRFGHPSCVDAHGRTFRGRRCAQRASQAFRLMEADMYNLYPEIGEVNQLRSNKPMGDPTRKKRELMPPSATFVGADAFLPRPEVRGDVARTYLYMDASYPGRGIVGRKRAPLFAAWDASDPVDAWECRRAWRIEAVQGNENPFVKIPCLEAGLWPVD